MACVLLKEMCIYVYLINNYCSNYNTGKSVNVVLFKSRPVTAAQDGGKVVSLTHWPHLPSGNTPGTHFC